MEVDQKAFHKLIEDSIDDYNLAEDFGFFVEDYILFNDDSHKKYINALRELPQVIRRLYLAFLAQIAVEGDGFQTYFEQIDVDDLMDETIAGLILLDRNECAVAYARARSYVLPFNQRDEQIDIVDSECSEIHSSFYAGFRDDFWDDIGKYIKTNRKIALQP